MDFGRIRPRRPWFVPLVIASSAAFAIGVLGLAAAVLRSGLLQPRMARFVALALAVLALARFVPLGGALYVAGLAGVAALWPLAHRLARGHHVRRRRVDATLYSPAPIGRAGPPHEGAIDTVDAAEPPRGLRPDLGGVPETTLWTLHARAREAARPGSRLRDPKAIEVLDALDFDFAATFGGAGSSFFGRVIGLRAMTFDRVVASVLRDDPAATVVVLGEGLETQFWRMDNGRVRWFTVELPETAAVREALLPAEPPRRRLFAGSALDRAWFDEVGPAERVVVIAQGLLMYLPPAEVRTLILACAARFPGGVMAFDTVPRFFSALSVRGKLKQPSGYAAPPMPWGVDPRRLCRWLRRQDSVAGASLVQPPGLPAPLRGGYAIASNLPGASGLWPGVVRVDFAPTR